MPKRGSLLRVLAAFKWLRGTAFDLFGYSALRKEERGLVEWYCGLVREAQSRMTAGNQALALEIANIADEIRGYEGIRKRSIDAAKSLVKAKLEAMKLHAVDQTRNS